MTSRPRAEWLAVVVAVLSVAAGCRATTFELAPVARVHDGTAQVRRLMVLGDLGVDQSTVTVDVDVYNGDPTRSVALGPPRLVVRSALGGEEVDLELRDPDTITDRPWFSDPAKTPAALPPRTGRTIRPEFRWPDGKEPPQGPVRIVVVLPVEGRPPLEVIVAEPAAGSPRWLPFKPATGFYLRGGYGSVGRRGNTVQLSEPFAFSSRLSRGRWVFGGDLRNTYLYREATPASSSLAMGFSVLVNLTWQPWTHMFAPYVEGGAFGGFESLPGTGGSQGVGSLRMSAGLLLSVGPRIGQPGALPIQRPLSPQRQFGVRTGYTRWFHVGPSGGSDGVEFSLELGFGR